MEQRRGRGPRACVRRQPRRLMLRPAIRISVWVVSMAGAFALTHAPPPTHPKPHWWFNDKVYHAVGFLILGFLTVWMRRRRRSADDWRVCGGGLIGLLIYAVFDEVTQPLVGRSCEALDWLADALGAVVGTLAGLKWRRWRKNE